VEAVCLWLHGCGKDWLPWLLMGVLMLAGLLVEKMNDG
jgi:hypothetical protein